LHRYSWLRSHDVVALVLPVFVAAPMTDWRDE